MVNLPTRALADEYSAKADAYARHWSPIIRPMALPLLASLPLADARRILDVGAGTGALLADLEAAATDALVIAIDVAPGMLRLAPRQRRTAVAAMDAQALGLRSSSADVAVLAFMLFHVPHPVAALVEVRRVLKPGGVIGVSTWGADSTMPALSVWAEELDAVGAEPDPRHPSVMQQASMDSLGKLEALLASSGYRVRLSWSARFSYRWSLDEIMAVQLSCGLAARRMAQLSSEAKRTCETRVRARLEALAPDALLQQPEVIFAIAVAQA